MTAHIGLACGLSVGGCLDCKLISESTVHCGWSHSLGCIRKLTKYKPVSEPASGVLLVFASVRLWPESGSQTSPFLPYVAFGQCVFIITTERKLEHPCFSRAREMQWFWLIQYWIRSVLFNRILFPNIARHAARWTPGMWIGTAR